MLTDELKKEIKAVLSKKTLIITVGNTYRSDDGVGIYIAEKLKSSNYLLLNAENKPENIIDKAVQYKPEKILIIDAADFGGRSGEARLLLEDNIPDTILSTHTFPIKALAKILSKDTKAPVFYLGVQQAHIHMGEILSKEVRQCADELIDLFIKCENTSE